MTRLTKSEIERLLLSGSDVRWQDASGKDQHQALADAKQRRLLAYLLSSNVRQPTGLSQAFVTDLSIAYEASDDPALTEAASPAVASVSRSWRLKSIETRGFGGLNSWGGWVLPLRFRWGKFAPRRTEWQRQVLVGQCDCLGVYQASARATQADSKAHEPRPVFATNDKPTGDWPPIASYPTSVADLQTPPHVYVKLTFQNSDGSIASVVRTLDGGKVTSVVDPTFVVPPVLIETGLLMPARFAQLRLDDGRRRLTDAVQKLTGLDDLVAIGKLVEGLCHKSREYRSYRKKELASARKQFDDVVVKARTALAPVQVNVQSFVPKDTIDSKGPMAAFSKTLAERAAELTRVISGDLAEGLDLSSPKIQHQVIAAIAEARKT